MSPFRFIRVALVLFAAAVSLPSSCFADVSLGEAAKAPPLPPPGAAKPAVPAPQDITVTGGFSVNTDSREEVRDFYNGIFGTSDNVPMESTADVPNCNPGQNSDAFLQAVLRRINWFRAMAGVPASVTLDPSENAGAQQVAVMISANHTLNHDPPPSFTCYNSTVAQFAGGNQAEGANGPDAVTDYIWDFGANNNEVGHRRWLLFPATQVMGTGDVPVSFSNNGTVTNAAANSIWVFDASINNPRPATRKPYVAWPPEGFVPRQVVYPYWSFALSNADVSAGQVTMKSNGVPVAVSVQPQTNGFGENTLVWVPMGLDASCECGPFPFNGTDTVYSVTVSNINVGTGGVTNLVSFSYNVTIFDPAVPGTDFIAPVVNSPAHPVANASNLFNVTAINDTNATGYQLLINEVFSGNVADHADDGLAHFSFSPAPDYSVITNPPEGSGECFHLCNDNAASQILQLSEVLLPAANTTVSFDSAIGFATTDETARVQVSTDNGASWQDIYTQAGCDSGPPCESSFAHHQLSLAAFAGQAALLRFDFSYFGGSYFPGTGQSGPIFGWCVENIVVTNASQMFNVGNLLDDTSSGLADFTFSPAPDYEVITNAPVGPGNCFHLCDDNGTSQILQLNETLLPTAGTVMSFDSYVGFATSDETAHAQISTNNGADWQDLFTQVGCNSGPPCDSVFTHHAFPLSAFAGEPLLLRFDYSFFGGSFFPGQGQSAPIFGWSLENIEVTNTEQTIFSSVNITNFTFIPAQPGVYRLQAVPVIFDQFPLSAGPVTTVTVGAAGAIIMSQPVVTPASVRLDFTVSQGLTGTFKLLQASPLGGAWTTNTAAVLSTNIAGSSYRFTTTNGPAARFYRVLMTP